MKIVIFENTDKLYAVETAAEAAEILTAGGAEVLTFNINELSAAAAIIADTDIIVVIGGDGTILKTAPYACEHNIPLLGINTGRLGFMASVERTELKLLERICDGNYRLSERMRICGEVRRGAEILAAMTATNEISAIRPLSKITDFTVRAGDKLSGDFGWKTVCGFRADGVLAATPTGSTAYALANGGAIIEPNAACLELTPVCAHSLSMRPMIFSSDTFLSVTFDIPARAPLTESVHIYADGVHICNMTVEDSLFLRKSDKSLKLIDLKPNSFYESVNGKLFQSLK